jgi:hypothetical protein
MATTANDAALSYFTLIGKCEEAEDTSYERTKDDGTTETIQKVQLSLVIPGMQDRVRVELAQEVAPSTDLMSQWELEENWLVVSASAMRTITFKRPNARAGEAEVGGFVVYVGTNAREATTEEREQLQAARKAQKTKAKQRRAERAAEKVAKKAAEHAAKAQEQAAA